MWRLIAGVALGLFLAAPFGVSGVVLAVKASSPVIALGELADLPGKQLSQKTFVRTTLRADRVHLIGWYAGQSEAVLQADGVNAYAQLRRADAELLQRDGHFELLGYVTDAPLGTPGVKQAGPQLVHWPSGVPTWSEAELSFAVALGAAVGAWWLISGWRKRRPAREVTIGGKGFFEQLAERYPGAVAAAGRVSINGNGLQWIDFHQPREDGSWLATQWLMLAFFPVAPLRRGRIRISSQKDSGVPFVVQVGSMAYERLEDLGVDATRNRRVYGFYFGVFLPLVLLPALVGFGAMVRVDFKIAASSFWLSALGVLAIGIGAVFLERRVMGPPKPTRPISPASAPPP